MKQDKEREKLIKSIEAALRKMTYKQVLAVALMLDVNVPIITDKAVKVTPVGNRSVAYEFKEFD